jgi:hypothetical protein
MSLKLYCVDLMVYGGNTYMKFRLLKNYRNPYDTSRNTKGKVPIPAAARSMAWALGCSLAGIADSNPAEGMDVCLL